MIVVQSQGDLFEVVLALRTAGRLMTTIHLGQEQPDQDDRNATIDTDL